MKHLWRHIPPFSPDTSGFAAVMNGTDGIGIIDDSRGCAGNYYNGEEYRYHLTNRIFVSEIANEDVIMGTENKIISKFVLESAKLSPDFAMLCGSPIASFIGTDLKEVAGKLQTDFNIPASAVDLTGHESYEKGIAKTLECLAQLLADPSTKKSAGINLIGATFLDWGPQNIDHLPAWCQQQNLGILSNWGGENTAANMRIAPAADCNLVLTVSGLSAGRRLNQAFGTPMIAGAPFGKSWTNLLLSGIEHKSMDCQITFDNDKDTEAIVIGEQFMANALRTTLRLDYGMSAVKVCSFFTLDRHFKEPGDILLQSEGELKDLFRHHANSMIIGDPFLRYFSLPTCKWIDLPHYAVSGKIFADQMPLLLGEQTNQWLDTIL